ncbi:hypothetical protein AVEN_159724-1 [Araneus ventricosus]|uniref:Uncharacterized protein n=1 Tax=Araneus ventricosus TaxID=182803 RepID=A0A4Y2JU76_ARAVE|nr:hypothetical protein AVEN_159724-1 [Araneus ventricosus]
MPETFDLAQDLQHTTKEQPNNFFPETHRKGVDGFSIETPGLLKDPVPISPSSDSLTELGHRVCANFAITKLLVDYVMYISFAYRQFNSNSHVVIRRLCRMSSSTAKIVAPLVISAPAQDVASP